MNVRAIFLFSVLAGALALGVLGSDQVKLQALVVLSILANSGGRL